MLPLKLCVPTSLRDSACVSLLVSLSTKLDRQTRPRSAADGIEVDADVALVGQRIGHIVGVLKLPLPLKTALCPRLKLPLLLPDCVELLMLTCVEDCVAAIVADSVKLLRL